MHKAFGSMIRCTYVVFPPVMRHALSINKGSEFRFKIKKLGLFELVTTTGGQTAYSTCIGLASWRQIWSLTTATAEGNCIIL